MYEDELQTSGVECAQLRYTYFQRLPKCYEPLHEVEAQGELGLVGD